MRFAVAALVAAVALTLAGTAAAHHSKHHPFNCAKFYSHPRVELQCARRQYAQARRYLPWHSRGYWRWREKVARRWIRDTRYRLRYLPLTNDWQTAVRIVQRVWPGTASWMLSCSAHEGGHGGFVMNTEGSGSGGWMQYLGSTFNYHYSQALALARQEHEPVPVAAESHWTSPLGQAFAAGWGYSHNRSAWTGDPYC